MTLKRPPPSWIWIMAIVAAGQTVNATIAPFELRHWVCTLFCWVVVATLVYSKIRTEPLEAPSDGRRKEVL